MPIAFDASSHSASSGSSTLQWSHACTGSNRVLVVAVDTGAGGDDTVTGVTYDGVALTQVVKRQNQYAGHPYGYLYILINPGAGTNNIVVTTTGTPDLNGLAASYTGCDQTTQPDASIYHDDNAVTTITTQITSVIDNCWGVLFCDDRSNNTSSASTNTTKRETCTEIGRSLFDTNGVIHPAGLFSMVITTSGSFQGATLALTLTPNTTSPSASISPSSSRSPSVSTSASASPSLSPSASLSPSVSTSASVSPSSSISPSASRSPSVSASASISPTSSISPSSSRSPSTSLSPSRSTSSSVSPSSSRSPSTSRSPSLSTSSSSSPSRSPSFSASASVSPSPGHVANVYLTIAGVHYATDRLDSTKRILHETLRIGDRKRSEASTCDFRVRGFEPSDRQEVVVCLGSDRIFGGTIRITTGGYVDTPANEYFEVNCSDFTIDMNKRKVLKQYTNQSATDIIIDIVDTYCDGYTTAGVDSDLPIIDAITFTNQDVTDCLTQIMNRVGGDWRCDYFKDIRAYLEDTEDAPTDLTSSHPTLEEVSIARDSSQVVTRALVEGYGSTAASSGAIGATSLAVLDIAPFNAGGGQVRSGQNLITYTGFSSGGTTVQGGSTTVAARPRPSGGPVVSAPIAIGPVTDYTGDWYWSFTYVYSDGVESTASVSNVGNPNAALPNVATQLTISTGDSRVTNRYTYGIPTAAPTRSNRDSVGDNSTVSFLTAYQTDGTNMPPTTTPGYSAGAAYVYVTDCAQFFTAGGTAVCGSQTFTYTGRSASSGVGALTGVSGLAGTIAVGATITAVQPAGSTSLLVNDTANFSGAGGSARVGSQVFTYTSRSVASGAGSLTGIPASGAGSLSAAVNGGDTVLVGSGGNGTLSGIPASGVGSIVYPINEGDDINIWVVVDDVAAQAALAALEGGSSDGIQEEYIQDRRISEAEANARGSALLALRSEVEIRLHYVCRDYLTAAGKTVHVNLTYPTAVSGDFLIQDVAIADFTERPDLYPLFTANTSTVRFTLEELLRMRRAA